MAEMIDMGGGDDEGPALAGEINVTPFVDVMLVLLIVFMVAAPLMMAGVPVQLPKSEAARVSAPREPLVVSIDREGRIFLRQDPVEPDGLRDALRRLALTEKDAVVYVRADRTIPYGRAMEVLGIVSASGFGRVSLLSEASTASTPPPAAR
ncbi:ExbD/TolR family protein [Stella sp.]|uniref:ExbD/TolR family protein n=1 Tax=Stella sp. TaxID=2912054 RepID=UPI0035B31454